MPPAIPAAPPPPAAPRAGSASAWIRAHRGAAIAIAAGLVAGVVVLVKRKSAASSSAGASTSTGTTGSVPAGTATYTDNQAGYNSLEQQLAALESQLATVTTSTSSDGTAPQPAQLPAGPAGSPQGSPSGSPQGPPPGWQPNPAMPIYVPPGQVNVPDVRWGPLSQGLAVIKSRGLQAVAPPHSGDPVITTESPVGGTNVLPGTNVVLGF